MKKNEEKQKTLKFYSQKATEQESKYQNYLKNVEYYENQHKLKAQREIYYTLEKHKHDIKHLEREKERINNDNKILRKDIEKLCEEKIKIYNEEKAMNVRLDKLKEECWKLTKKLKKEGVVM